jgi:hypothetical protein
VISRSESHEGFYSQRAPPFISESVRFTITCITLRLVELTYGRISIQLPKERRHYLQ